VEYPGVEFHRLPTLLPSVLRTTGPSARDLNPIASHPLIMSSAKKHDLIRFMDRIAPERDRWIRLNRSYYEDLTKLLRHSIPSDSSILEIGCGTGFLLNELTPTGGEDRHLRWWKLRARNYPHKFPMDAEALCCRKSSMSLFSMQSVTDFQRHSPTEAVCTHSTDNHHLSPVPGSSTVLQKLHLKMAQKR
jgi:hypothetical protein